jgi:hypothetical protein
MLFQAPTYRPYKLGSCIPRHSSYAVSGSHRASGPQAILLQAPTSAYMPRWDAVVYIVVLSPSKFFLKMVPKFLDELNPKWRGMVAGVSYPYTLVNSGTKSFACIIIV